MADRNMNGIYPILSTPFDEKGRIDVEDLERQAEWMVECGVGGVGIAVASEIYKLTDDERDLVLTTVVKQVNGRVKVVMNTGAQGTDIAIHYSRRAQELGADALMIRPATFIPVPPSETVEYFRRIAAAVDIPIFMQDQSDAQVPPALAVRVAREHENLCYIKVETPPTVPRVAETAAVRGDSGLVLFGGAGGAFMLEEARRGSVGSMPGATIPDVFVRVWNRWHDGDEQGAEQDFRRYAPLLRTLGQGQGLAAWLAKEVLVRRGILKKAYARHPALRPDGHAVRELDVLLDELDLVKA